MFEHIPVVLAQDGEPAGDKAPKFPVQVPTGNDQPKDGVIQDTSGGQGLPKDKPGPMGNQFFLLMLLMLGVFMFMMMSGSRREKKKQAKMLAAMGKGSKVVTAGGILGTVVELRDHEVVVKVDENANTRLRFTREAIKSVLKEDEG